MSYIIEKGVPVEKNIRRGREHYPLAEMEVGDSFTTPEKVFRKARRYAYLFGQRNGMTFTASERGFRIWRIA